MQCTLCHSSLQQKADDEFFICSECGSYVKQEELFLTPDAEKKRYDLHGDSCDDEGYLNFTQPLFDSILSQIPKPAKGLDYGCGRKPALPDLLQKNGYSVALFDPYYYPEKDVLLCSYDFIYCCEVVEHFYDPAAEFEKLFQLLNPGGSLFIMTLLYDETTDFKNWHYRRDPTHVFIFTEKTIKYLRAKFRFNLQSSTNRLIVLQKSI